MTSIALERIARAVGLQAIGFGVVSHGLHVVNSGLDWRDVTGLGSSSAGCCSCWPASPPPRALGMRR